MDIFAHALWTNAVYAYAAKRKGVVRPRRHVWLAILFGIAPDIVSFGPTFVASLLGYGNLFRYARMRTVTVWLHGTPAHVPDATLIPNYVYQLYNFTHSFVIFAAAFLIAWMILKKPYWLMGAWGLHIGIDIWSHTEAFFPTPIFFPLSSFHVSGVSWANPIFMAVNYAFILAAYIVLYLHTRKPRV